MTYREFRIRRVLLIVFSIILIVGVILSRLVSKWFLLSILPLMIGGIYYSIKDNKKYF